MAYEKTDSETGRRFTWQQNESLSELIAPERIEEIRANMKQDGKACDGTLSSLFEQQEDEADDIRACLICDL